MSDPISIRVEPYCGVVRIGTVEIRVVNQDTLDQVRAGVANCMTVLKQCNDFTDDLVALLDKYHVLHFAAEHLT